MKIQLGPAQIEVRIINGLLRAEPFQVAVGDGRVQLAPSIDLNSEPLWMTLGSTSSAEGIHLTREMTGSWMKYVAPLLADATDAEGAFSVAIQQAEIPLLQPYASRIEGQLKIHSAALGPGPLSRQLIDVASQIKRLAGQGDSRVADPAESLGSAQTTKRLVPTCGRTRISRRTRNVGRRHSDSNAWVSGHC